MNAIRFGYNIFVADPLLGGVVRADNHQVILGQPYVFFPTGLAADEETLWVADWAIGVVWQVGFVSGMPQTPVVVATGLSGPEGLALDHDGGLLVVEAGAHRLSRIDLTTFDVTPLAEGLELRMAESSGLIPPTYSFNGVAVGPSGAIYVTGDTGNVLYRIWPR
jgi:sugar lactone lactonase YvrE